MFVLLLSGDGTVIAEATTRAQLPLLLAQAANLTTVAVGLATETDTALPITVVLSGEQLVQVGLAEETDIALPVTVTVGGDQSVSIGLATETDTALPITFVSTGDQFIPLGVTQETDTAFPITVRQSLLLEVTPGTLALITPAPADQSTLLTPVTA